MIFSKNKTQKFPFKITIEDATKAIDAGHWCSSHLGDDSWNISLNWNHNNTKQLFVYDFYFKYEENFCWFTLRWI